MHLKIIKKSNRRRYSLKRETDWFRMDGEMG